MAKTFENASGRFGTQSFSAIVNKANKRTLTEIAKKSVTLSVKEVRKKYNITARDLKEEIFYTLENRFESAAYLHIRTNRIPLDRFGMRKVKVKTTVRRFGKTFKATRYGVSFQVKKGTGRKRSKEFFTGRLAKGRVKPGQKQIRHQDTVSIFKRQGKSRLPTNRLLTVGPGKMFLKTAEQKMIEMVNKELPEVLWRNMQYYMKKGNI